jgi:hypothetical protein
VKIVTGSYRRFLQGFNLAIGGNGDFLRLLRVMVEVYMLGSIGFLMNTAGSIGFLIEFRGLRMSGIMTFTTTSGTTTRMRCSVAVDAGKCRDPVGSIIHRDSVRNPGQSRNEEKRPHCGYFRGFGKFKSEL